SREFYERITEFTPGTQSNLRRMPGYEPPCMVRGEGSHIWDIDGNEYIDYIIAVGPGIFGYGNPEFTQALKDQIDTMYFCATSGVMSDIQLEVCQKFVKHTPCADKVRFAVTGSEAVQLAIRLARAYTGRQYFIRFEGAYHGWPDNVVGGRVDDNTVGKPFAISGDQDNMRTEGKSSEALHESFMLPWNDIDVMENVLEKYGDEVAMVMMDPIPQSKGFCFPLPGYLERIRELCTKYGIVLCFDEVMTGFRVGLNSAQGLLGVTPDLATFGKAIAGGMPLAAIAGKKEIMDLLLESRVIGAGTFNGYPLGIAASLAALSILERDNGAFYKKMDKVQIKLMNGLKEISKRHGIPMLVQGPRGVFITTFIDKEVIYNPRDFKDADTVKQNKFRVLLTDDGVLPHVTLRWFISGAHTDEDIDKTLECADKVMAKL
ncbi:aspartate aminotransferase family protein, partial [Chloroflexota bacterium]